MEQKKEKKKKKNAVWLYLKRKAAVLLPDRCFCIKALHIKDTFRLVSDWFFWHHILMSKDEQQNLVSIRDKLYIRAGFKKKKEKISRY